MGKSASGPVFTCTVSPSPRLLVSAGPASSCLWSWQLVMGPEEEMVFASLSGEVFLYRAVPWPQRRAGLFRTVECSSFLLRLETLEFPRVHFFPRSPSLDLSGRGWAGGISSKGIKCPAITQWGAQLSHLQKYL